MPTRQEVLMMSTMNNGIRCDAVGWATESGAKLYKFALESGVAPEHVECWRCSGMIYHINGHPDTPANALAAGWKLLGKPEKIGKFPSGDDEWGWWFVRDVEV